jgi:hypothetical protein
MDPFIYKKYTLLKTNNNIWKKIWSIKNNTIRNNYIDSVLIHLIKDTQIDLYYKDNLIVGMPSKKYNIYYDIYFNVYSLTFDIILYHSIDDIKQYSNYIYQNSQPEDIFLYLMQNPMIKETNLLNSLLKQLNNFKNQWYYTLLYLIKKITYKNSLCDINYHILDYLMVYK